MNLPNILTTARLIIGILIPAFFISENVYMRILGAIVFTIGALTDYFDGKIARKHNIITTYGKIVDPIADKVLVLMTFFTFSYLGIYSFWLLVPIVARELIVTIFRFVFLNSGKAVAAEKSGKIKTTVQMITLGFIYIYFMTQNYFSAYTTMNIGIFFIMYFCIAASIFLTLYSGLEFFINNWKLVNSNGKKEKK